MTKDVLVIEDHELNRVVLLGALQPYDVNIEVAEDGRIGLEKLMASRPDLLLLDLQLPEIDGETILTTIRADEHLKSLSVVVITAKAMKGERQKIMDLGADEYVAKPIRIEALWKILDRYIERKA